LASEIISASATTVSKCRVLGWVDQGAVAAKLLLRFPVEQPRTCRCRSARRYRWGQGGRRCRHQRRVSIIRNTGHQLRPGRHFDIQGMLATSNDQPGLLEQNAQLSIGMRRTGVGQNHYSDRPFARDLHRDRTGGRAHLPHVRHAPNLPV
jgi:hypothetical protein